MNDSNYYEVLSYLCLRHLCQGCHKVRALQSSLRAKASVYSFQGCCVARRLLQFFLFTKLHDGSSSSSSHVIQLQAQGSLGQNNLEYEACLAGRGLAILHQRISSKVAQQECDSAAGQAPTLVDDDRKWASVLLKSSCQSTLSMSIYTHKENIGYLLASRKLSKSLQKV